MESVENQKAHACDISRVGVGDSRSPLLRDKINLLKNGKR